MRFEVIDPNTIHLFNTPKNVNGSNDHRLFYNSLVVQVCEEPILVLPKVEGIHGKVIEIRWA